MHLNRYYLLVFAWVATLPLYAQNSEVSLNVGDSLTLNTCTSEVGFTSIDLMVKTRFPNPDLTYNKETGQGFYNWFFDGDVDSRRLPCTYSGRKFRIAGIHQFDKEDGGVRTVLFGQLDNDQTVLWVEIDVAMEANEIIF